MILAYSVAAATLAQVAPSPAATEQVVERVELVEPRPPTDTEQRDLDRARDRELRLSLRTDELWLGAKRRQIAGWLIFSLGIVAGAITTTSGGLQTMVCSLRDATQSCQSTAIGIAITGSIVTLAAIAVGLPLGIAGNRDVAVREARLNSGQRSAP